MAVPQDRNGSFEPQLVPKHARRLAGFTEQVLSPNARGTSVTEIRSRLVGMHGVEVSPDLIGKVTDAVADELAAWHNQPQE
ncbi:transposase [Streptomyces sp. NPDC086549]|uniref:transposase n=1 Tax=Streptomyces sp. NPDC086549 TaxID=3365752 RepID=UPI003825A10A